MERQGKRDSKTGRKRDSKQDGKTRRLKQNSKQDGKTRRIKRDSKQDGKTRRLKQNSKQDGRTRRLKQDGKTRREKIADHRNQKHANRSGRNHTYYPRKK